MSAALLRSLYDKKHKGTWDIIGSTLDLHWIFTEYAPALQTSGKELKRQLMPFITAVCMTSAAICAVYYDGIDKLLLLSAF